MEYVSFNFTLSPGTQLFLPLYIRNGLNPLMRQALGLYKDEFIMPDCYAKEKITLVANFILYELMNNQTVTNYSQHVNIAMMCGNINIECYIAAPTPMDYTAVRMVKSGSTFTGYFMKDGT